MKKQKRLTIKKVFLGIAGVVILLALAFYLRVYIYGAAKVHYCSKQLRESVPRGASLTDERFKVYTDCYHSLGFVDTLRLIAGKSPMNSADSQAIKTTDKLAVIREFMADSNRELVFTGTDLPMPYFRVGKVTQRNDGENMEAVEGWVRMVNVYEDAKPLAAGCGVYQYHVDPRSNTLTQAVTRGLRPNEIEALKAKGTPCTETTNQVSKMTKADAEQIAFGYLERALPNFGQIRDQFIYTQKLGGQSHDWIWEDKDYQLPDGLEGRPYSHPIVRMTVYGNGSITYQNTLPLFEN